MIIVTLINRITILNGDILADATVGNFVTDGVAVAA
jgi:hypothetical protein